MKTTLAACAILAVAHAQEPPKEFEVASIKPSNSTDSRMMVRLNPGGAAPSSEALSVMFQSLLTSRFHLEYHRETKDVPAYALVAGKSGVKMKESEPGTKASVSVGPTRFKAAGMPMQVLANTLSRYLGRLVVDETILTGSYDLTLEWAPDDATASGPRIFTAIQEQLGLKLESKKAPVNMFIIDRLDRPEPN